MSTIQWVKPAPLWKGELNTFNSLDFRPPRLAEFETDTFLTDFLDLVQGRIPGQLPAAGFKPPQDKTADNANTLKLYLPAHGRYYLVTASLVCRKPGLPDRVVARELGQQVYFVVRRLLKKGDTLVDEQGWIPDTANGGWTWHDVADSKVPVRELEERLPLNPATVCAIAAPESLTGPDVFGLGKCGQRVIYYGYVPAAGRDKYLAPFSDPVGELNKLMQATPEPGKNKELDPRLGQFETRVLRNWRELYVDPMTGAIYEEGVFETRIGTEQLSDASLYVLVDLADFLSQNLPGVWAALLDGSNLSGTDFAKRAALLQSLRMVRNVLQDGTARTLIEALQSLQDYITEGQNLAQGEGQPPQTKYNLREAYLEGSQVAPFKTNPDYVQVNKGLYTKMAEALNEEKNKSGHEFTVPPEVARVLKVDPADAPASGQPRQSYCLRLVYRHPPCCPVESEQSAEFIFAKFFDPDAPARPIRIELPSIKLSDLRKYKRGVGMQMTPELRSLMDRINTGMLDGGGLSSPGGAGWELGMICCFSLPIITLVAFIVMFIFLILLNIIFWWMAFLKICFPIPHKQ